MKVALFLVGFWAFVAALVGWILLCVLTLGGLGVFVALAPAAIGVSVLIGLAARDIL